MKSTVRKVIDIHRKKERKLTRVVSLVSFIAVISICLNIFVIQYERGKYKDIQTYVPKGWTIKYEKVMVHSGDTLEGIVKKFMNEEETLTIPFSVEIDETIRFNNLVDPSHIEYGDYIYIPYVKPLERRNVNDIQDSYVCEAH